MKIARAGQLIQNDAPARPDDRAASRGLSPSLPLALSPARPLADGRDEASPARGVSLSPCPRVSASPRLFVRRLHADQRGTISIVSVFALFLFTLLLVMVVNVGRHLDDKMAMQNAADAAAYSGGVVLARGMNALAYTNHLLCDVFAVTAFLREGRDRNAERLTPFILDAWERAGNAFAGSSIAKWQRLGNAILDKARKPQGRERELVAAWGEMTARASEFALPVYESILRGTPQTVGRQSVPAGLIPQFQRAVVQTIPQLAQQTTDGVARRHSVPGSSQMPQRPPLRGALWRMNVTPLTRSVELDPRRRTLPVVDPDPMGADVRTLASDRAAYYFAAAVTQRRQLAKYDLELWTRNKLSLFERHSDYSAAQMSQFSNLWRIFTCAQLERLLAEYPQTNLPMQLRLTDYGSDLETQLGLLEKQYRLNRLREADHVVLMGLLESRIGLRRYLETNFNYLAVSYRQHLPESGPGLFRNPLAAPSDAQAFAQVTVSLPHPRLVRSTVPNRGGPSSGGTIGYDPDPIVPPPPPGTTYRWAREGWPVHWDLLNQNWTCQLVPAEADAIGTILQSDPGLGRFRPPTLTGLTPTDLRRVTTH